MLSGRRSPANLCTARRRLFDITRSTSTNLKLRGAICARYPFSARVIVSRPVSSRELGANGNVEKRFIRTSELSARLRARRSSLCLVLSINCSRAAVSVTSAW